MNKERVITLMQEGQEKLVTAFESLDDQTSFKKHTWHHQEGGGGTARVLENGTVFEKAGINTSAVYGKQVPLSLAQKHKGIEGKPFFATGISMVLHPQNPYVPTFHANYRYFEVGETNDNNSIFWFGGGADLTPYYVFEEDVIHFHKVLKAQCDRHGEYYYPEFKRFCDEYFFVKHRGEMRGVGGIFFDELQTPEKADFEHGFAFVKDGIDTILTAYLPIVKNRKDTTFGENERSWQLYRRGRYVEFNLVYDRGTRFGLQTDGNIEAILMSLPAIACWKFDYQPNSEEEKLLKYLKPKKWV